MVVVKTCFARPGSKAGPSQGKWEPEERRSLAGLPASLHLQTHKCTSPRCSLILPPNGKQHFCGAICCISQMPSEHPSSLGSACFGETSWGRECLGPFGWQAVPFCAQGHLAFEVRETSSMTHCPSHTFGSWRH